GETNVKDAAVEGGLFHLGNVRAHKGGARLVPAKLDELFPHRHFGGGKRKGGGERDEAKRGRVIHSQWICGHVAAVDRKFEVALERAKDYTQPPRILRNEIGSHHSSGW